MKDASVPWAAVIMIPGYTLVAYYIIKAPVTLVLIGGTARALGWLK